jgi:hypothetical protein
VVCMYMLVGSISSSSGRIACVRKNNQHEHTSVSVLIVRVASIS